jgi:hypothetical protein
MVIDSLQSVKIVRINWTYIGIGAYEAGQTFTMVSLLFLFHFSTQALFLACWMEIGELRFGTGRLGVFKTSD